MREDLEHQFNYAKIFVPTLIMELSNRKVEIKIKDKVTLNVEGGDVQNSALLYLSGIIIAHENL
jgi:hypothetical protein